MILKLLRDKGDFNNDNKSEYATRYISVECWVIRARDFIRTASSYLCLALLCTSFISLRGLGVIITARIFVNLVAANYKDTCEVLHLVVFLVVLLTEVTAWRLVLLVFVMFLCNTVLEATASGITKTQQKLEVNSRISKISIPIAIIVAKYTSLSKLNSICAIFLALGIPKLVHYHRNHRRDNRYEATQIASLLLWQSADLPWIFCPEALVGWILFVVLHHAYGAMGIDRKSAYNESYEAWQKAAASRTQ